MFSVQAPCYVTSPEVLVTCLLYDGLAESMIVTFAEVLSVFPICRWPLRRGREDQEGCREASGGRDSAGVPARLSWGGVRRQPPVPWPRRLPAQVRQLVFTLALQECLLQSLLHQISLDTDAGGAKECVCQCKCVYACLCLGTRKWHRSCPRPKNHQRATKRHLKAEFWVWGDRRICTGCVRRCKSLSMKDHPNRHHPHAHHPTLEEECVLASRVHQLTRLRSFRHQPLGLCSHAEFPDQRSALPLPPSLFLLHHSLQPCVCLPEWRRGVCPVICPAVVHPQCLKVQLFGAEVIHGNTTSSSLLTRVDVGTLITHKCTRA